MSGRGEEPTSFGFSLDAGVAVGPYRILHKIGSGGMGEVYLAQDTKLDRNVALKFLPQHLVASAGLRQRFDREAKAVARLNHPNIVTVHDVGDFAGAPYLVMEYVDGQTLQTDRSAPRPIDEVVNLSLQIAHGLAEAHRAGIVHRDIKPTNVIVDRSGRLRLLDFGLASLSGSEELTRAGTALGTIAYMSPEQVSGRDLDPRSDLFSFGILIYEMVAGRHPFRADNDGATLRAIIDAAPRPLGAIRPDTPAALDRLVMKALEKDPRRRYSTCEDLIADLKKLLYDSHTAAARAGTPADESSIVVVPFTNISADPANEYFSDGLTEEIITDLAAVRKLRVISRSSSNLLKGTARSARTIGAELGVRHILTGSVRKAGNNVRIAAQLVDASCDVQIWTDKYAGTLDDIFEMQETVSRAIVGALKLELTRDERQQMGARPIQDARAYEYYLRARQDIQSWNEESLERAESYLMSGLEIVGENALLYAALAWVYVQFINIGKRHDEWIGKARDYADKALALDRSLSECHHVRGLIASFFEASPVQGMAYQRKAVECDPTNTEALFEIAFDLGLVGCIDEAFAVVPRLKACDPLTRKYQTLEAWLTFLSGDFEKHLELRLKALAGNSEYFPNRSWLGAAYVFAGDPDKASDAIRGIKIDNFAVRLVRALIAATKGESDNTLELLTPDFERTAYRDPQFSMHLAQVLTIAGQTDRAVHALANAVKKGFWNYPYLSSLDPYFPRLKSDPRFHAILEDVRRKWEHARATVTSC